MHCRIERTMSITFEAALEWLQRACCRPRYLTNISTQFASEIVYHRCSTCRVVMADFLPSTGNCQKWHLLLTTRWAEHLVTSFMKSDSGKTFLTLVLKFRRIGLRDVQPWTPRKLVSQFWIRQGGLWGTILCVCVPTYEPTERFARNLIWALNKTLEANLTSYILIF